MSKAQEIEILRECVERLGRDSYCGPWLKDQIPFIEHDIRCAINDLTQENPRIVREGYSQDRAFQRVRAILRHAAIVSQ